MQGPAHPSSSTWAVAASAASSSSARAYLIVAGPIGRQRHLRAVPMVGQGGGRADAGHGVALGSLRPEALFAIPQSAGVRLLSDDGGMRVAGPSARTSVAPGSRFGV